MPKHKDEKETQEAEAKPVSATQVQVAALTQKITEFQQLLDGLTGTEEEVAQLRDQFESMLAKALFQTQLRSSFKKEFVKPFADKPYAEFRDPAHDGEYVLASPRMTGYQFGWLERQDEAWNYFRVSRFLDYIIELPDYLKQQLGFRRAVLPVKLEGDVLTTEPIFEEKVMARYGDYIISKIGKGKFKVRTSNQIELVTRLLRDGILPYVPKPIDKTDLSDRKSPFDLKPHMQRAWETFQQYGHIGMYWPFGSQKTRMAGWIMTRMKGPHLVFVHNKTLAEQWRDNMTKFGIPPSEYTIATYQSLARGRGERFLHPKQPYSVVTYEESHHLPADTFSQAALIPCKYRIGCSGTPFREDGREYMIAALTGVPSALTWEEQLEFGAIKRLEIHVHILKTVSDKFFLTDEIVGSREAKTIVFVWRLAIGKKAADMLGVPFLSGETPPSDRLAKARSERVVVMSDIGSEGLSLPTLQRVVELDFMYGGRSQASQRLGRLLHSQFRGEHHILMTEDEFYKYKKRLYPMMGAGYNIMVHHAGKIEMLSGGDGGELPRARARTPRIGMRVQRPRRISTETKGEVEQSQPVREGPNAFLFETKGVKRILASLPKAQRKLMEFLVQDDGVWYEQEKLSLNLGYITFDSFRVTTQFSRLVDKGYIERKRDAHRTFLRTNFRGKLA